MSRWTWGWPLLLLGATGCPNDPPPDPPPFAESVDGLANGVGLGAWSDGDDLLIVGGQLSGAPGQAFGGPGRVLRIDGEGRACKAFDAATTLWWIHGAAPGHWYAVGEGGTILHHQADGVVVDESVTTNAILYGVYADAEGGAVAVGGDPFETQTGEVWRRDQQAGWTQIAADLPGVAFKVWEDWIVGDGVAWQLDGDTLLERHPPNDVRLLTVRGRAPDDVYAVGGNNSPVVLRWDGAAWSSIEVDAPCATGGLNGVWTAPGEDVWVAGFFGGAARYDGESWECSEAPLTYEHYHATWRHAGETWWVGGNLLMGGGETLSLAWTGGAPPSEILDSCE